MKKLQFKFVVAICSVCILLLSISLVFSIELSPEERQVDVVMQETDQGVTFDFSENPIEGQIRLVGTAPDREPINMWMQLGKKKVVGGSCEGPGTCVINNSTAAYALKRIVFSDGTATTF